MVLVATVDSCGGGGMSPPRGFDLDGLRGIQDLDC